MLVSFTLHIIEKNAESNIDLISLSFQFRVRGRENICTVVVWFDEHIARMGSERNFY